MFELSAMTRWNDWFTGSMGDRIYAEPEMMGPWYIHITLLKHILTAFDTIGCFCGKKDK